MAPDDSFAQLMTRLRAGDEDAAAMLFHRFACRLIGLARLHLDARVRAMVDAEDVVQSAFRSFFLRAANGQFDLEGWNDLWALLTVITLRKCGRQVGYWFAARRDVRREVALPSAGEGERGGWEALAREPTPEEVAVLTLTLEQLMRGLDEQQRKVLELRLQGHSLPEISSQVGRSEYLVNRILKRVQRSLEQMQGGAEE
jgi:RNA polymerase sigma-70 factor (ECF subfamily)